MSGADLGDKLRFLIEEFERSSLRVVHIRRGEIEIHLSRDASTGLASSRQSIRPVSSAEQLETSSVKKQGESGQSAKAEPAASAVPDGCSVVAAPNIGTFYRSPKPGAPPYVDLGQPISVGDEVCLIEVMKLFTAVRSDVAGTIKAILVEDGAMVEAGQPLFAVEVV